MGSYFSKKKSLEREFADIEDKILKYEDAVSNARLTQRKVFSRIILYGLLLEILLALWTYYRICSSMSFNDNLIHYSLLVISPITLYCFTKIFNYIYVYKIHRNESKLDLLKTQLQQKIDARKKETDYDNTQKIIDKYERLMRTTSPDGKSKVPTPSKQQQQPPPPQRVSFAHNTGSPRSSIQTQLHEQSSLRHRPMAQQQHNQQHSRPSSLPGDSPTLLPLGRSVISPNHTSNPSPPSQQQPPSRPVVLQSVPIFPPPTNYQSHSSQKYQQYQQRQPRQQSWLDKIVDYIISDGPKYGSPLICHNCHNHNGYVPTHELESIQFRCRFCQTFNQRGDNEAEMEDGSDSKSLADGDKIPADDIGTTKVDSADASEDRNMEKLESKEQE